MAYVYVIKSTIKNWKYIGSTRDLRQRFREHNDKRVKSTKAHAPFVLVYYEAYQTYGLARKRELELKNNGQQKELLFNKLGI